MKQCINITDRLQRRMLEIVSTALPLIAKSRDDADLVGLAHLRGEMIEAINAYSRHVDGLKDAGQLPEGHADRLIAGCVDLRGAYDAFRSRWNHRDGMSHWHEYRLSAVVMMKQVRALVQEAEALGRSDGIRAA